MISVTARFSLESHNGQLKAGTTANVTVISIWFPLQGTMLRLNWGKEHGSATGS